MKTSIVLLSLLILVSAFFCCSGDKSETNILVEAKMNVETNSSIDVSDINLIADLEKKLERKGIKSYGVWKLSEKPNERLFYFIGADKDGSDSESLIILDGNGKLLFQDSATDFDQFFTFNILRESRPQLIIPGVNYGGSGRFFRILDYSNGKVISLNDEDEALYSGDFTIMPQYQEKGYFGLPYQVLLTEYAASGNAEATILRYLNGKYVSAGKVDQRDLWIGKAHPNHSREERR